MSQILSFQHVNNINIINEIFLFLSFYHTKSSNFSMYAILIVHLSSDFDFYTIFKDYNTLTVITKY